MFAYPITCGKKYLRQVEALLQESRKVCPSEALGRQHSPWEGKVRPAAMVLGRQDVSHGPVAIRPAARAAMQHS